MLLVFIPNSAILQALVNAVNGVKISGEGRNKRPPREGDGLKERRNWYDEQQWLRFFIRCDRDEMSALPH